MASAKIKEHSAPPIAAASLVEIWLAKGVDVNAKTRNGTTALMIERQVVMKK
jgi:hypothetical protein